MQRVRIAGKQVLASGVLSSYWHVAAERQRVYHARLSGSSGPWTTDPVIARYKFTNAYRAADRVSQDLIRVAYEGSQVPQDLVLRVLLYRFFNKPSTWNLIEEAMGEVTVQNFDVELISKILDSRLALGQRVYSAAYIVPPPPFGAARKHRNHLLLIRHMLTSGLPEALSEAPSLETAFEEIRSFPSLGPFLAYQLCVDFNYTALLNFSENDFVVAGPGALSGVAKCFPDRNGVPATEIIRWMVENQNSQLADNELEFHDLFGRALKLIDCQNLFCETDKYARVAHPDVRGVGKRTRIKQQFVPTGPPAQPFFPPKWKINDQLPAVHSPTPTLF